MAKATVDLMARNQWGRIIDIASNSVGLAFPGLAHYMAGKMAVIGFTRGLASDLGERGITVNAIGPTATPLRTEGARPPMRPRAGGIV